MFQSILAIVSFELSRLRSWQRVALSLVLILFPPAMFLILWQAGALPFPEFAICVLNGMTCLLVMMLWATPNVYAELEGRSWVFVTSRPYGRLTILAGKYLISAGLSFFISWTGMSLCMLVAEAASVFPPAMNTFRLWLTFSGLLALASIVYSAIFSFLGTVVQRRAMVFAFGYFMVVEVLAALVPAVIGKLAMTYHLMSLLFHWTGLANALATRPDLEVQRNGAGPGESADPMFQYLQGVEEFAMLYGIWPQWLNLAAIATMSIWMMSLAATVIRSREYMTLEDSQV